MRVTVPFTVVGVYRARNAGHVRAIRDDTLRAGGAMRLWSLDEVAPELAAVTIGRGPGARFELLNRLIQDVPPDHAVVVADDDVRFVRGTVEHLLQYAYRFDLSLAQPAHGHRSNCAYRFTRRRPWALARSTTFVEIGPVVAVHHDARGKFIPFPTATPMGWGVDILWRDMALAGTSIGIIDAVAVEHLGTIGSDYDAQSELLELERLMAARNLKKMKAAQGTQRTFWRSLSPRNNWTSE